MAETLPHPVRLRLEQTLAQWRHWHAAPPLAAPPRVERVLGDGHSNYNVLVAAAQRFVVRIDGIDPTTHGLHRQGEWHTLQAAHGAGVAPRPCYFNPDLGSLVCAYLEPDPQSRHAPEQIAALLRRIHRLPACHTRLDLGERILRYERRLAHRQGPPADGLAPLRDAVVRSLAQSQRREFEPALCHNDLLHANRIPTGGALRAIDWEYSAMGDPLYDLAVVIAGDDLDPDRSAALLRCYLGRAPAAEERAALGHHLVVYRYLALLWYLVQDHPVMDPDRMARDIGRLREAVETVS